MASFAVVVVALAAGFAWYERSRPSSKLVAVVATMGALTALGRDAFAALPDVKPTTAMVFVCGYVFGAGPGFAVGAVGALASNVVLGEGPWTPWQMLAWGAVGIVGALLGRITGRRLGRVALALACALAAGGFNLVMDAYTWTLSGSHTLAAFVAVLASALTFDLTHVAASFGFGLAFGPSLVRMLDRVRIRMDVHWRPATSLPLVILLSVISVGTGAASLSASVRANAAPAGGTAAAVGYLRKAQNRDGGFGGAPGQASSEEFGAWTAMGLAAAGVDPQAVARNGHTVVDALRANIGQVSGASDLERTILALYASRVSPNSFGGRHLVAELLSQRSGNGSFAGLSNATAFAIFALRAAGRSSNDPTVGAAGRWLGGQQNSDGGFGFGARGVASDIDDTAAAAQALVDVGAMRVGVGRATAFLRREQNGDGGFPLTPGSSSNAQSSAWAIQALLAAGVDPGSVRRNGGPTPLDYLHGLSGSDGSVRYSASGSQTPVWVTAQALTALGSRSFPVAPPPPGAGADLGLAVSRSHGGASASPRPATGAQKRGGSSAGSSQTHGRAPRAALTVRGTRRGTASARLSALRRRVDALARASGALAGALFGPMLG